MNESARAPAGVARADHWLARFLHVGAGFAGISLFALSLAAIWTAIGLWLARRHARVAAANQEDT